MVTARESTGPGTHTLFPIPSPIYTQRERVRPALLLLSDLKQLMDLLTGGT